LFLAIAACTGMAPPPDADERPTDESVAFANDAETTPSAEAEMLAMLDSLEAVTGTDS
jgi:hypothetical protein